MDYSRTFGSNFPNSMIPYGSHKDVDNTVVGLVNQYNTYIQSGNMTQASQLYEANKFKLEPYIINMTDINRLEEEIYNTGLYALSASASSIISSEEPTTEQANNSYWFLDY